MRANLPLLMQDMRPMSDEQARELRSQAEAGAGRCPEGFVAAEYELFASDYGVDAGLFDSIQSLTADELSELQKDAEASGGAGQLRAMLKDG